MAIDEDAYLNKGNYTKGGNYITAHKYEINPENELLVEDLKLNGISCTFEWKNIQQDNSNSRWSHQDNFAWLEPIKFTQAG